MPTYYPVYTLLSKAYHSIRRRCRCHRATCTIAVGAHGFEWKQHSWTQCETHLFGIYSERLDSQWWADIRPEVRWTQSSCKKSNQIKTNKCKNNLFFLRIVVVGQLMNVNTDRAVDWCRLVIIMFPFERTRTLIEAKEMSTKTGRFLSIFQRNYLIDESL